MSTNVTRVAKVVDIRKSMSLTREYLSETEPTLTSLSDPREAGGN